MNQVNQKTPVTIRGVLTDIRSIPTQTGTAFVVCKVGEHRCKLFGDLAELILANQYAHEGQEMEAYGHWDARRGNEFIIEGFESRPSPATAVGRTPATDNRPEKPAMKVKENYIVITIPHGATPEQLRRITEVGNEALRGLETKIGPGVFELATIHVTESDQSEETDDIPF